MKGPALTQSPRKFSILVLFVFLALFIAICVRPLGNNRMSDAVLGSFDSTGAAILLIGFPYLFHRFY